MEEWIDGWMMASLNSVQKDDLTSSLFHFDHFKESLEVDAGESHDKRYCSKTAAITHLQIPSPVTQAQTNCKSLGPAWKQQDRRVIAS